MEKLVRKFSEDKTVLFDLVKTQEDAAAAIEKGWNESVPLECPEDSHVEDFDDDDPDGDYNGRD